MSSKKNSKSQISEMLFVKALYKLISTARIHKDNNTLLRECLTKFKASLIDMTKERDLTFQAWRYDNNGFDINFGLGRGMKGASDTWVAKEIFALPLK